MRQTLLTSLSILFVGAMASAAHAQDAPAPHGDTTEGATQPSEGGAAPEQRQPQPPSEAEPEARGSRSSASREADPTRESDDAETPAGAAPPTPGEEAAGGGSRQDDGYDDDWRRDRSSLGVDPQQEDEGQAPSSGRVSVPAGTNANTDEGSESEAEPGSEARGADATSLLLLGSAIPITCCCLGCASASVVSVVEQDENERGNPDDDAAPQILGAVCAGICALPVSVGSFVSAAGIASLFNPFDWSALSWAAATTAATAAASIVLGAIPTAAALGALQLALMLSPAVLSLAFIGLLAAAPMSLALILLGATVAPAVGLATYWSLAELPDPSPPPARAKPQHRRRGEIDPARPQPRAVAF